MDSVNEGEVAEFLMEIRGNECGWETPSFSLSHPAPSILISLNNSWTDLKQPHKKSIGISGFCYLYTITTQWCVLLLWYDTGMLIWSEFRSYNPKNFIVHYIFILIVSYYLKLIYIESWQNISNNFICAADLISWNSNLHSLFHPYLFHNFQTTEWRIQITCYHNIITYNCTKIYDWVHCKVK